MPRIAALARWVWLNTYAKEGVSVSFAGYIDRAFDPATLRATLPERMWLIEEGEYLLAWVHVDLDSACPTTHAGPTVEITRLYVAPSRHGQGFGRRLLAKVCEVFVDRAVWLSTWEGNAGALSFYRREGAEFWGETWFELDGQRHRNEVLAWPALKKA